MRWFAKKVVDIGGGKDLKSRYKSYSYFFKIFNFVKIRKILVEKTSKLSDRCPEKNAGSSVTLVNDKLKFARYNRSGGVGTRAARFIRKLLSSVPKLGYRAQNDPGAEILCNISAFIKKIIVASKRIRSDSCTEKMSDATSRCQPAGASCRGSILIEFAVCMPILIILLFYINDLEILFADRVCRAADGEYFAEYFKKSACHPHQYKARVRPRLAERIPPHIRTDTLH